jgi:REP-associated tyrosine transposase
MARRRRFHSQKATYHVMLRGNDGQQIFFCEADRVRLCLLMQEGVERFGHQIHAFCFMSNHIHLAIEVSEASISRIIQHLAFRYTRYINRSQKRIGHLFQGRFKSILVQGDLYMKELVRYIHLNPVRSGMVALPDKYVWSSHNAYMQEAAFTWLEQSRVLHCFGDTLGKAVQKYGEYVLKGIGKEPEFDFKSGDTEGILGTKEFAEDIIRQNSQTTKPNITLAELILEVCKRYRLSEQELCMPGKHPINSRARAVLALLARETKGISIEELARFLKREASGVSKLAIRLEKKSAETDPVAREIQELRNVLFCSENHEFAKTTDSGMSECQA